MSTVAYECRVCGLALKATGDPETPFIHDDEGDALKRQASVIAHYDAEDAKDARERNEA